MNYFGLFFTFMVPGILLGIMASAAMRESVEKRRRAARRREAAMRAARSPRLFVYDLGKDAALKGTRKPCAEGSECSAA